jgi:hypothetical protein
MAVSTESTVSLKGNYLDSQADLLSRQNSVGTVLTIYDLKAKYIAFRDDFGKRIFNANAAKAIGEPIKHIVVSWDSVFIFTDQNNVFVDLN